MAAATQLGAGYLIGPYDAAVEVASTSVYCDDFARSANVTNLAIGRPDSTRYGGISQTRVTANDAAYDGPPPDEDAIGDLFGPNPGDPSAADSTIWLFGQENGYIGTDTANLDPKPMRTLEPSSSLLLGFGLIAVSIGGRRAMKRFKSTRSKSYEVPNG